MRRQRLLTTALLAAALFLGATNRAEESWFVGFDRIPVAPVSRDNVTQLVDGGVIETDGFATLRLSLAGEFKESVPSSGQIGALLIPNLEPFDYLLRNEGQILFPIEISLDMSGFRGKGAIFVSPQESAPIAFPSYRVYLFNETGSGAEVSLFAYRSR